MPSCKKCDKHFPNLLWIGGKKRNLCKRKYCLVCSPFDQHNTKQKHISDDGLVCVVCGKSFKYRRGRSSHSRCHSCIVNARKVERKRKCVRYKGGACLVCGYNKCVQALDFHHVDPIQKKFTISGNHCLAWEKVRAELDKCILLCNRCHSELHAGVITCPVSLTV